MARVFISHAAKDHAIVDLFYDLLQTGLELAPSDVFCTSLESMGIPSGTKFVDYIKSKIQYPELVIMMMSPNYFDSMFCLCELGAAWVLSNDILPILIPPANNDDLKAVLTGVHARKITDKSDLSEIRDELVARFDLQRRIARWDAKKSQVLKKLPALLAEQTLPQKVDAATYKELEEKYNESTTELANALQQIEALKKCKDAEEVADVDGITRCLRFIALLVVSEKHSVDEIRHDLHNLGKSRSAVNRILKFVDPLLSEQRLSLDLKKMLASVATIATVESMGFSIDARAVYDDEDTLLDFVPVLVVHMTIEGVDEKSEFIFQLNTKKLQQFCTMFEKQKENMTEFSKRITISKTTPRKQ